MKFDWVIIVYNYLNLILYFMQKVYIFHKKWKAKKFMKLLERKNKLCFKDIKKDDSGTEIYIITEL